MADFAMIQLQEARRRLADLKKWRAAHRKLCRQCRSLTAIKARWCQEGWDNERDIRQAAQLVGQLTSPDVSGQLTLF